MATPSPPVLWRDARGAGPAGTLGPTEYDEAPLTQRIVPPSRIVPEFSFSFLSTPGVPPAAPAARRAIIVLAMALLGCLMLAACSPRFNWREVRADEAGYRVMFPDRPDSVTRAIHLDTLAVDMTMQGARVEGMTFAVGTIRLPTATDAPAGDAAALEARRTQALEAMRTQMVRNIHGHEMKTEGVEVTLIDGGGQKVGTTEEAMAVEVVGERPQAAASTTGAPLQLNGRFVGRGDHVYQVVVLGPRIDAEQATTFLESFKLLR